MPGLNQIGVMQGRLLPKYRNRYQAHPVGYWQNEFDTAKSIGLDLIEFIFDYNDVDKNPLMSESGIDEILTVTDQTGVDVKSICADYFMEAPLHGSSKQASKQSLAALKDLIFKASRLNVKDIVIPCVDKSSFKSEKQKDSLVKIISEVLEIAEKFKVNIALETDLAPGPFHDLLERFDSPRITVNYDTGNSAALGFDPEEEVAAYGDRISDIHIKDRLLSGESVVLGVGNTDLDTFFSTLEKTDYNGPFIIQAYRDDEGVDVFKQQFYWLLNVMKNCGIIKNMEKFKFREGGAV